MKKADVTPGSDYAVQLSSNFGTPVAHRVRVDSVGPRSEVVATVIESAADNRDTGWRKGRKVTITSRQVTCRWVEWPDIVKAYKKAEAARKRASADRQREIANKEEPDPDRTIPPSYEREFVYRDDYKLDFEKAIRVDRPWSTHTVPGALELLPMAVQRDVVAAAIANPSGSRVDTPRTDAVCDVYASAVYVAIDRHYTIAPDRAIAGHDEPFASACRAAVESAGEFMELPFVPRVRRDYRTLHVERPALGWIRLAFGETSGEKLHSPNCSRLSRLRGDDEPATMPLWMVSIGDRCVTCGGPQVRPNASWVAFRAASDAWEARGRTDPEVWQIRAVLHMIAAAATDRAAIAESDRTREALIRDTLADGMPGVEGWDAYRLTHRWPRKDQLPQGRAHAEAQTLARRRLNQLAQAIPESQRPPVPVPLQNAGPDGSVSTGHRDTVDAALRDWLEELMGIANIKDLHLTLFGLPGAIRR